MIEVSNEIKPDFIRRQTAPVYSQVVYLAERDKDLAVGDYAVNHTRTVSSYARNQVVLLIEELHETRNYMIETLYTAVNLVDRYLSCIVD